MPQIALRLLAAILFLCALPAFAPAQDWVRKTVAGLEVCVAPTGEEFNPPANAKGATTTQCQVLAPFLDWLIHSAEAANLSQRILASPDGNFYGQYPNGDGPPASTTLSIDEACVITALAPIANLTEDVDTDVSYELAACRLGSLAASGAFSITNRTVTSGTDDWVMGVGTDTENTVVKSIGTHAGSGSFKLTLTASGNTDLSDATFTWVYATPPVGATDPPNVPARLTATGITGGVRITGDSPTDPCVSGVSEGVQDVQISTNGGSSVAATVSVAAGLQNCYGFENVGLLSPTPTHVQDASDATKHTLVSAGTIDANDKFGFSSVTRSGAHFQTFRIDSCSDSGGYDKCGVMIRDAGASASATNPRYITFHFVRDPSNNTALAANYRNTDGLADSSTLTLASNITLPICVAYDVTAAGVFSFQSSTNCDNTYVPLAGTTWALPSSYKVGQFVTSTLGTAGATTTGVLSRVNLNNQASWTTDIVTASPITVVARARDAKATPNASAYSPSIGPTTPGAAPGASAIKWHPGHYIWLYGWINSSEPARTASVHASIAQYCNDPTVEGYLVLPYWDLLENDAGGDYSSGLSWFGSILDQAEACDQHVMLKISERTFSVPQTNPSGILNEGYPSYLWTGTTYGPGNGAADGNGGRLYSGVVVGAVGDTNGTSSIAKMYSAAVMDRVIALGCEYLGQFDDHDAFEMLSIEESGSGLASVQQNSAALYTQMSRLATAWDECSDHTAIRMMLNFTAFGNDTQMKSMISTCAGLTNCLIGGPDPPFPPNYTLQATDVYRGAQCSNCTIHDFRSELRYVMDSGTTPFVSMGAGNPYLITAVGTNAKTTLNASHMIWFQSNPTFGTVIYPYFSGTPTVGSSDCPPNFTGGCDTTN